MIKAQPCGSACQGLPCSGVDHQKDNSTIRVKHLWSKTLLILSKSKLTFEMHIQDIGFEEIKNLRMLTIFYFLSLPRPATTHTGRRRERERKKRERERE